MTKIYGFDNKESDDKLGFPTIIDIYKQSIITAENYYDDCIILSVKTSNSLREIEKMEFHKFRNLMKSLNKYIDAETKAKNGESGTEDFAKKLNETQGSMKASAKNMAKAPKTPKIKKT